MKIDALIPARGSSRRLPGKHLLDLGGHPLLDWTLRPALECALFRRVVLSTDDPELQRVGDAAGTDKFPLRPAHLAEDGSSSADVLWHYLQWLREENEELPEWVMLLQPTSPFRGRARLREACELAESTGEEVVSLGPLEKPLAWCRVVRQERAHAWACPEPPPLGRLNGAIYLTRIRRFLEEGTLLSDTPRALLMEDWESVDIDTPLDLTLARAVARERFPGGVPA